MVVSKEYVEKRRQKRVWKDTRNAKAPKKSLKRRTWGRERGRPRRQDSVAVPEGNSP